MGVFLYKRSDFVLLALLLKHIFSRDSEQNGMFLLSLSKRNRFLHSDLRDIEVRTYEELGIYCSRRNRRVDLGLYNKMSFPPGVFFLIEMS